MKIHLIAIGTKMPSWVEEAYQIYQKRLPADYQLKLIALDSKKRLKHSHIDTVLAEEAELIRKAIPPQSLPIALDRLGKAISTVQIAEQLQTWHDQSQDITLLIGGPEGLHPSLIQEASLCWSLSALTLAHPLVRVVLAEQLYRAWSIIANHPYHR